MLAQGKANLQAPWLGLTGFFVIAIMLSLLIFIGEGVRDAFDPRKLFAAAPPPEDTGPAPASMQPQSATVITSYSIHYTKLYDDNFV